MEALILGALKWRMRSITPFSFISYFISFFNLRDPPLRLSLKARASEIIFKAQNGNTPSKKIRRKVNMPLGSIPQLHLTNLYFVSEIKLLEFRPSIIAASALLSAAHELLPLQYPCFRKAIFCCSYVNKVNILTSAFLKFSCCYPGNFGQQFESILLFKKLFKKVV